MSTLIWAIVVLGALAIIFGLILAVAAKVFEVEVEVGGKAYARASASSKKSAETKAARASLKDYAADCANAGGDGVLPADPPSPAEGKTQPERKKPKAERQKKR